MTDRRLQVFHAVARLLSFTKAAEALHMTQPAVTFQIRQLEDQFDTRLFDRTHNRVTLTESGKLMFCYSEKIFGMYAEMEAGVRDLSGEMGGAFAYRENPWLSITALQNIAGKVDVPLRFMSTGTISITTDSSDYPGRASFLIGRVTLARFGSQFGKQASSVESHIKDSEILADQDHGVGLALTCHRAAGNTYTKSEQGENFSGVIVRLDSELDVDPSTGNWWNAWGSVSEVISETEWRLSYPVTITDSEKRLVTAIREFVKS